MKKSRRPKKKTARSRLPGVDYRKTVLPNGLTVLTENHPLSRAVSCGIWIDKGTRDENADEAGLAHFVEHLVFKRTENRSAFEIARDMEAVGGDLNAFTSRESTCFLTFSLKEHLGLSIDVLSDLVCRPKFATADIKKEKQVVISEIHMSEDQLEDHIFDRYFELVYPESTLGKPILGSIKSIENMKRGQIVDFHRRQYTTANTIVSVAGNVDHDETVELVEKHMVFPGKQALLERKPPRPIPEIMPFRECEKRPSEQAHILIGLPAAEFCAKLRFEAYVVNTLLGGGMTSRLYQTVREERGLVYTIYSQLVTYIDAGQMLIYAGADPKNMPDVVELIMRDIRKLKREGLTKKDLEFFKTQVKGQILLGADDIDSRMNSLAVNEMVFGKYRSVDDVIQDIESVSLDSVHEYIQMYFDVERIGMLVMGRLPEGPTRKWLQTV